MTTLKALLINSKSESEIEKNPIVEKFRKVFAELESRINIDEVNGCDEAFLRVKNDSGNYDFFIINSSGGDCYSYSLIDYLGFLDQTDKLKLIIGNNVNNLYKKNFIPSKRFFIVPNEKIVQITEGQLDERNELKRIIKTLVVHQPTIYISYGNDESEKSRILIDDFKSLAKVALPCVNIKYDKESLKMGDNLENFMLKMSEGDIILIIMNQKYFESQYCMKELSNFFYKLKDKIYPIFLEPSCLRLLSDFNSYTSIIEKWAKEKSDLEDKQKGMSDSADNNDPTLEEDIKLRKDIIKILPEFRKYVAQFFALSMEDYKKYLYLDIFQRITEDLKSRDYINFYSSESEMKKYLQQHVPNKR